MSILENLAKLKNKLPENVILVAVSKTKPNSSILEAYNAGQRIFGENKIQEMVAKYHDLPKDIKWHMIGHLQRNKIKYIAEFVDLIHGIDSFKTLKEINKQAKKHNRIINCLLQVKIATEDTKFGLSLESLKSILQYKDLEELENLRIIGLMGMASFTTNTNQINKEFASLKKHFEHFKNNTNKKNIDLKIRSMGMSNDYELAINNGSNMIRVGSAIFGSRNN